MPTLSTLQNVSVSGITYFSTGWLVNILAYKVVVTGTTTSISQVLPCERVRYCHVSVSGTSMSTSQALPCQRVRYYHFSVPGKMQYTHTHNHVSVLGTTMSASMD